MSLYALQVRIPCREVNVENESFAIKVADTCEKEFMVAVIDDQQVHLVYPLTEIDALSLMNCAAEDPQTWRDIELVWPRYIVDNDNTPTAADLPYRRCSLPTAVQQLGAATSWLVLDLVQRRMLSGGNFPWLRFRNDEIDEDGPPAEIILLPPWWELRQRVTVETVGQTRLPPCSIGHPRRDILWGTCMTQSFAKQMLQIIREGQPWSEPDWQGQPSGKYDLTVRVHRDWLMTPLPALDYRIPRDCLHLGTDWISALSSAQEFRVHQQQESIPTPTELSNFESAPMGFHEVLLYFEACRDTIAAGWRWLLEDQDRLSESTVEEHLSEMLFAYLQDWLSRSFEGGAPANEIIWHERIRIPLVSTSNHIIDCDCPICLMMAAESFGPSIQYFDGHALEVDDEFAFSMLTSREAWEEQQRENAVMRENIRIEMAQEAAKSDAEDPLGSPWKQTFVDDSISATRTGGMMTLAFLLAEIVDHLKSVSAPQTRIHQLNESFVAFLSGNLSSADELKERIESLATDHPDLVARCADLQSRIDEQLRAPANDGDPWGIPF